MLVVRQAALRLLAEGGTTGQLTCYAVGHSIGGASLALAGLLSPGAFTRFVLIEPIVFPVPSSARGEGLTFMAAGAIRRKAYFPSPRHMATAYRSKKAVFGRWDPRSLELYANKGMEKVAWPYPAPPQPPSNAFPFCEAPNVTYSGEPPESMRAERKDLWRLKCPPWVEAENFQSGTSHGESAQLPSG